MKHLGLQVEVKGHLIRVACNLLTMRFVREPAEVIGLVASPSPTELSVWS